MTYLPRSMTNIWKRKMPHISKTDKTLLLSKPADDFIYNDVSLDTLISAQNETYVEQNVGRSTLCESSKVANEQLCLKHLIKPPSIIENDKYTIGEYTSPQIYLYRFDNCYIGNTHGVILRPEQSLFFGPSARFLNRRPVFDIERSEENLIVLPENIRKKAEIVETALIFHSAAVNNYYHWHVETLPLLFALRDEIINGDIVPVWQRTPNRFQKASLELMGLESYVRTVRNPLLFAKRAFWASSLKSFPNSQFSPLVSQSFKYMKSMSDSKGQSTSIETPKKIQIIRPGQARRPLVNESELTEALSPLGCVPIDPGTLSYDEQINLFSNAKVIVGQHGGALTNIGFCRPGTKLLEIVGETYVNPCFWGIAHISGVLYAATNALTIDRTRLFDKNEPARIDIDKTLGVYKALL